MANAFSPGRLLVTGALGTVAGLVMEDLARVCPLFLTDRREGEVAGERVHAVDLLDFAAVQRAMKGCDTVLHLAIASGREFPDRSEPPDAIAPFEEAMMEVNTRGAYHLFEAARRTGVRRVLLMSSLTVLLGYPTVEERARAGLPALPAKLYAVTKLFGEELGSYYHRVFDLEVLTMRLGQPYPLGTYHDGDALATAAGRQFAVHRDDIVAGVLAALSTPVPYAVFNLASRGDPCSVDFSEGERIGYSSGYVFREDGAHRLGRVHET